MPRRAQGASLIEATVVLAVLSVVAAMALPSYQSLMAHQRRGETVNELRRLQQAQEDHRRQTGRYALTLGELQASGVAAPQQALSLVAMAPSGYILRARPPQDLPLNGGCQELTLSVSGGVAITGPSARCWNE